MQLFIDTADLETIREAYGEGIIQGVTTNPLVIKKEDPGIDVLKRIEDIAAIVPCVSVQLLGLDDDPAKYLEIDDGIVVKTPLEWLPKFHRFDVQRMNLTAIVAEAQATLAIMARPRFMSIFWNRAKDSGNPPDEIVKYSKRIIDEIKAQEYESDVPEVIIGSIRNTFDVVEAIKAGADIVTVPPVILAAMHKHHATTKFLAECAQ